MLRARTTGASCHRAWLHGARRRGNPSGAAHSLRRMRTARYCVAHGATGCAAGRRFSIRGAPSTVPRYVLPSTKWIPGAATQSSRSRGRYVDDSHSSGARRAIDASRWPFVLCARSMRRLQYGAHGPRMRAHCLSGARQFAAAVYNVCCATYGRDGLSRPSAVMRLLWPQSSTICGNSTMHGPNGAPISRASERWTCARMHGPALLRTCTCARRCAAGSCVHGRRMLCARPMHRSCRPHGRRGGFDLRNAPSLGRVRHCLTQTGRRTPRRGGHGGAPSIPGRSGYSVPRTGSGKRSMRRVHMPCACFGPPTHAGPHAHTLVGRTRCVQTVPPGCTRCVAHGDSGRRRTRRYEHAAFVLRSTCRWWATRSRRGACVLLRHSTGARAQPCSRHRPPRACSGRVSRTG